MYGCSLCDQLIVGVEIKKVFWDYNFLFRKEVAGEEKMNTREKFEHYFLIPVLNEKCPLHLLRAHHQ